MKPMLSDCSRDVGAESGRPADGRFLPRPARPGDRRPQPTVRGRGAPVAGTRDPADSPQAVSSAVAFSREGNHGISTKPDTRKQGTSQMKSRSSSGGDHLVVEWLPLLQLSNKPRMLVLETPYWSLVDAVRQKHPYIPSILFRYRLPSHEFLESVNCPIHLIHGTQDEKIPFNL